MKEKETKCQTCKKQPKDITTLSTVDFNDVKLAYEYVSIASRMNDEKWDFVEDVYLRLFPAKKPMNRQCGKCLANVAKGIEYEYKRLKNENQI